jgi:hypothetical protein
MRNHNTFMVHTWLLCFVVFTIFIFSQSTAYSATYGMVGGKLVAATEIRTETGPDGRTLTVTFNVKTGAVLSRIDIYGQSWAMVGGKLVTATGSKTIAGPDGRSLTVTNNLKSGATINSVDIYGNKWGIDEKGKLGTKGSFVMIAEALKVEVVNGTEVTKMKDLLTGKISGTDILGNHYGIDKDSGLGTKGSLVMTEENLGTEVIDGTEVTKMKDLLTGKISGTDILGNRYSIKDGKLTLIK